MQLGLVGLGKMGGNMRERIRRAGHEVVGYDRDKSVSISSFRAQLKAIHRWGKQGPDDLSRIDHPVLMMNGDHDRMVPTVNTIDMARRFPNAELTVYPDAGHGGVFQYHEDFVNRALDFLER